MPHTRPWTGPIVGFRSADVAPPEFIQLGDKRLTKPPSYLWCLRTTVLQLLEKPGTHPRSWLLAAFSSLPTSPAAVVRRRNSPPPRLHLSPCTSRFLPGASHSHTGSCALLAARVRPQPRGPLTIPQVPGTWLGIGSSVSSSHTHPPVTSSSSSAQPWPRLRLLPRTLARSHSPSCQLRLLLLASETRPPTGAHQACQSILRHALADPPSLPLRCPFPSTHASAPQARDLGRASSPPRTVPQLLNKPPVPPLRC